MNKQSWGVVITVAFLVGCGPGDRVEITHRRTATTIAEERLQPTTSAERFGLRTATTMERANAAQADDGQPTLDADVPDSWTTAEPTSMRELNFRAGESQTVECYVTRLSGAAGGVAANVNRWQTQMGQPPLSEHALNNLEQVTVMGSPAVLVAIEGTGAATGRMILGVISIRDHDVLFVKMLGPKSEVITERSRFVQFVTSLRRSHDHARH